MSAVLVSLRYEFLEALFISIMLVPGCIVLKFVLPKVSFSNFKKGLADIFFISAAVMVSEMLFLFCSHIAILGLPAIIDGHAHMPSMLINPAFLAVSMAFITGGDYLLSRYLKKAFAHSPEPVVFTSDYRKVSLDASFICGEKGCDRISGKRACQASRRKRNSCIQKVSQSRKYDPVEISHL